MAKRETLSTKLYFVDLSVDVLFLLYLKLKKASCGQVFISLQTLNTLDLVLVDKFMLQL